MEFGKFDYGSDAEVIDTENYTGTSDSQFSHEALIMRVLNKCMEAGCREMRSGWFNQKVDKNGNTILQYIDDTRKQFIESVKSAETMMICDFDEPAKTKISEQKNKIKEKYSKLCDEEMNYWNNLPRIMLNKLVDKGISYRKEKLNRNLDFFQDYIEFEVEIHREILKELILLTERKGFYKIEDYTN